MSGEQAQDSVPDVERLRAALDEIVSTSLNFCPDRDDEYSLGKEDGLDRAATIARAALAVPINKIGEDAK